MYRDARSEDILEVSIKCIEEDGLAQKETKQ
jgi:hypothetical protein